jgi:alanine racemase
MTWRNRVEINYSAIRKNVATVCAAAAASNRQVIAVVKADAYGIGLDRCARLYHDGGVAAFAVAAMLEADRIRRIVPEARVILLGSPLPEERRSVVYSGYEVCCSHVDELVEYAHLASHDEPMPVHIMVDTGMGRFGALPEEAVRMVEYVLKTANLRLVGIGTHYPQADHAEIATRQERDFSALLQRLPTLPNNCWIHFANSEGVLLRPAGPANVVRVGLILTGVIPRGCPNPGVEPVLRWVSSLSLVKHLPKGHSISYNGTHVLTRDSRLGIVPVGYADGLPISLSNRGFVLVQGKRCPILGRVTMDYCIIDLTDVPHAPVAGETVVLIGQQGDEHISVADLAQLAGTIPYDILCGLRGRCEVVGIM